MQQNITKECKRCHIIKPLIEFSPKKKMKLGVHSFCKECIKKKSQKYREKNKNRTIIHPPETKTCNKCKQILPKEQYRLYPVSPDGLLPICKKCCYDRHRKLVNKNKTRKTINIPEYKICPQCKIYLFKDNFHNNRSRVDGLAYFCKKCSKEKTSIYDHTAHTTKRYNTDPLFRLKCRLRGRMKDFLRRNNKGPKLFKTLDILGCTAQQCFSHLETLFWPGMTRENMGKKGWHIDHIMPLNSFNLTNPEEQKKAFHYTNLQPLWADDNLHKQDSLDWTPACSKHPLPERLKHHSTMNQTQSDEQQPPQWAEDLAPFQS